MNKWKFPLTSKIVNFENSPKIESIKFDFCPRKSQCELGDFNLGRECFKSKLTFIMGKRM